MRSRRIVLDLAMVAFVTAVTEWQVFSRREHLGTHVAGPRWLTIPLPLLIALPLLWRRRRPLLVCAVVTGGIVAQALASGHTPEGLQIILLWIVVPYSVAMYAGRRRASIGLVVVLVGFGVYAAENDDVMSGSADALWSTGFFLALAVASWVAGTALRARRHAAAQAARAAELERQAQEAGAEERARIARELHDIVSHNLSVVVVQAAGAQAQSGAGPGALEKIERSGRDALMEMRRLLGVLRDGAGEQSLEPQPGISQLPKLAERLRAADVSVELAVEGDANGLPPSLDLSAYRIVQEALTNTLKHAGEGARARVRVSRCPDALTIEVSDDGGRRPPPPSGEPGHGLVGMRERAAVFGGELHAHPRPGGGFVVSARLPLHDGAP